MSQTESAQLLTPADVDALANAARLFGQLLLVEIDRQQLEWLHSPDVGQHLELLGVDLPPLDVDLDELAAEFHGSFLAPDRGGAPLVASLWTEGRYEGWHATRIRDLAASAAVEFHGSAARGASVDHLGVVLHLWAKTSQRAPRVADELSSSCIEWAERPLAMLAERPGDGFYSSVAQATHDLVVLLRKSSVVLT